MYVVYNRGTCTAKVFINNRPATEVVLKLNHREDVFIIRTIHSWVRGRVSKGELPVQNYTVQVHGGEA